MARQPRFVIIIGKNKYQSSLMEWSASLPQRPQMGHDVIL